MEFKFMMNIQICSHEHHEQHSSTHALNFSFCIWIQAQSILHLNIFLEEFKHTLVGNNLDMNPPFLNFFLVEFNFNTNLVKENARKLLHISLESFVFLLFCVCLNSSLNYPLENLSNGYASKQTYTSTKIHLAHYFITSSCVKAK